MIDTSFLIRALVSGSPAEASMLGWLTAGESFTMSTVAWSEFLGGPLSPDDELLASLILSAPEPFLPSDARRAAALFNATSRRSRSMADCQIAAVAIRCGASLATANTVDFVPFQSHGLTLA